MSTRPEQPGAGAALLVIDLQRGLFQRPTPVYEEESLLRNISGLVSAARAAGIPVVFVRHSNKMLVAGTENWELHPDVLPREGDLLVDKTQGDALQDTELDALLKARCVGTVYVTGLVTEGCARDMPRRSEARLPRGACVGCAQQLPSRCGKSDSELERDALSSVGSRDPGQRDRLHCSANELTKKSNRPRKRRIMQRPHDDQAQDRGSFLRRWAVTTKGRPTHGCEEGSQH